MINFKLDISYDGTDFYGWQIQKNKRSVQGDITAALEKITRNCNINIIGSGRTDTGVHAYHQIANVKIDTSMSPLNIKNAINSNTCSDIHINSCKYAEDNFHSRFNALKREYIYYIINDLSPVRRKYTWNVKFNEINLGLLDETAKIILGKYDFSSFCKKSSLKDNNECFIFKSEWIFYDNEIQYRIISNRFLHHMVRFLVGTMIEVARDKISLDQFKGLLLKNKYDNLITKSPSQGLFLNNVFYDK